MNLFQAVFTNKPSSIAVLHKGREITYGDLQAETLKTAGAITSLGIRPGDRVALLLHDSPEFIEAFIAICSLGAITVPINMALPVEDQRSILHNSGARLALMEDDIRHTLLTGASEKLRQLQDIVVVDQTEEPGLKYLRRLKDDAQASHVNDFPEPEPDQPSFILYTSGSTGEPKGAIHTQAGICHTNRSFCSQVLKLTPGDRLFSSSRLPFAYGFGNSCSFPLLNGATTILCKEKPNPDVIDRVFGESRPTIFFGVPVVYNLLLEHHRSVKKLDCSSLRMCVSAGEALPAHLGKKWEEEFGVPLLDGIGSTEMLHMFMSNHENDVCYGSSGKLLAGYEAQLRDEHGEPAQRDEGNLWIKGASAALGYWQRPEETSRTFVDGWVRTGDLYRRDNQGFWFHLGRSDDCFKSSGQWVSPVEVEGVLIRHERVRSVAVVEDFNVHGLPCACAFVVCDEVESDTSLIEKELGELANGSLPNFKRPKRYVFVKELPYTATGKVQRFKLRQGLRSQR